MSWPGDILSFLSGITIAWLVLMLIDDDKKIHCLQKQSNGSFWPGSDPKVVFKKTWRQITVHMYKAIDLNGVSERQKKTTNKSKGDKKLVKDNWCSFFASKNDSLQTAIYYCLPCAEIVGNIGAWTIHRYRFQSFYRFYLVRFFFVVWYYFCELVQLFNR